MASFAIDDRVSHDIYGLGRVISTDTEAVMVVFGAQRVRVASPFRKLQLL